MYFGCRFSITLTLGQVFPINIHDGKLVLLQFLSVCFRHGVLRLTDELISVVHKLYYTAYAGNKCCAGVMSLTYILLQMYAE